MRKKIAVTMVLVAGLGLAQAHEFWLQPVNFFLVPGGRLYVKFMVGENFIGEPWNLKKHRVEKLELHSVGSVKNIADSLQLTNERLQATIPEAGTKMIVMESNTASLELEGPRFNEYLKEDGLDDVYSHRERMNDLQKSAREMYSRHTKLLVQVGEKYDNTFKKVVGLPIEIIPETNPYTLKKGDALRFTVLYEGKPLFGAKVRIWNRFDNRTTIQNIYTEKNGTMEMRISNPGPWMVTVVKMIPSKQADTDWRSYWGSLVFGVKQ